ncbi:MAG: amidohydrolase, partial [Clostridia bacterium]|nr:amidohydrolase [Clostridia bacterium]
MKDKLIKQFINSWSDEYAEDFHQIAKKIWEISELSMQEYGSAKILMDKLKENGFTIEAEVADMPTAFIATYGQSSPVIGINAEYDALPGLSQKTDSLKKEALIESGPGHGCGHNLLGTASVKAAIAIKNAMDKFKLHGTVKVIGAPAEELCLGKPLLGKAGLLENFDAFLDWHPWTYNRANYDSCCAYFSVKYHYTGRTCHGNSPWHGRSALDAAILQSHGVEMLREHTYPGCPPDAANTINYTFTSIDPEFPSVVPDKATAWYIGRFITIEDAENGLKRITNCAKGAALSTETEVKVELITATHHKIPNKTLAQLVHNNFQEIGAPKFTEEEHEIAKKIQKE